MKVNEISTWHSGHGPEYEYPLGNFTVSLYRIDEGRNGLSYYWFNIEPSDSKQFEVLVRDKTVLSVKYYKHGNADPIDRQDLISAFQRLLTDYELFDLELDRKLYKEKNMKGEENMKREKNTIKVKKEVRIPGTNYILEAGDMIEILKEGRSDISGLVNGLSILQRYDPYVTISNSYPDSIGVDSTLLRSISNPDVERMYDNGWTFETRLNRWFYKIGA